MPNKYYQRAYRQENKVVNKFKQAGAILSVRTAGSHSPFDVISIKGDTLFLIQCKKCKNPEREKKLLRKDAILNSIPLILKTKVLILAEKG